VKAVAVAIRERENSEPCAQLMGRTPLRIAYVIGAALAASLVGAAPDCTAAVSGCSANSEDVEPASDKNLLARKAEPHPSVAAALPQAAAAVLVNESRDERHADGLQRRSRSAERQEGAQHPDHGKDYKEAHAAVHRRRWKGVDPSLDFVRRRRRRDQTVFEPLGTERRRRRGTSYERQAGNRMRDGASDGTDCGDIELKITSASGLRDADKFTSGTSDPWVRFTYWLCGDLAWADERPPAKHTQYVSETVDPIWNYKTTVKSIDFRQKVLLEVIDADKLDWEGDNLGQLKGYLKDLAPAGEPAPHDLTDGNGATLTWGWKSVPSKYYDGKKN